MRNNNKTSAFFDDYQPVVRLTCRQSHPRTHTGGALTVALLPNKGDRYEP